MQYVHNTPNQIRFLPHKFYIVHGRDTKTFFYGLQPAAVVCTPKHV